jgi:hypothetical protein
MSGLSKLGVVLAGYVATLFVACGAAYFWTLLNPSPGSQGMQAFGDTLLFVGLFCVMSLVPTGLAFYFLRPFEKFWTVFSIASLVFAATGPFAAMTRWLNQSGWTTVEVLGLPRVMAAPLFGLGFLTCAVIAPTRRSRWVLLAAAGIEFAVSVYAFFCLFVLSHWLL